MRRKSLSTLFVAALFVALTFTAVGLGWSERVEALAAATQYHRTGLTLDSSVSDPEGDVRELRLLRPFPYGGRDLTIEGNTAKVLIPSWVLREQAFQWAAATLSPLKMKRLDVAPDYQVLNWASGAVSEAPDAQNPELLPYEDLTYVRLREVASSRLEFLWRCRGDIPMSPVDVSYGAFLGAVLVDRRDYMVVLTPTDAGWLWYVSAPGEKRFALDPAAYEDILSATVSQSGDGQLRFEMTMADRIPDAPSSMEREPWFSWVLDVDRDQASGGADVNVVVRWNQESSQWEGALMGWTGQYYEDLDRPVTITRSDWVLSATVSEADLALDDGFLWLVRTTVNVGPAGEQFVSIADQAPDSGWAGEGVSPPPTPTPTLTVTPPGTQRIYLPVIMI